MRRHGRWRRVTATVATIAVSAVLAFLLLPTDHLNTRSLIQVNGVTCVLPSGLKVSESAEISALLARPGSTLNLTGDVTALGGGSSPKRWLNGKPLQEGRVLNDGATVLVRHGEHVFEAIKRVTADIPFETTVKGEGAVVSLVRAGALGQKEIFKGVSSGKQAAVFVVSEPLDAVLERTSTAGSGRKLAALTFDDGPGTFTQGVLDALAAKHVPATFFVLGSSAAGNKALIAKIKKAGHEVENHSWDHPVLTGLSPEAIRSQISRTSAAIGGSSFLRPPYGIYDAKVAAEAAALGNRLVLWTVDTLDWKYPDVDSIVKHVKAQTKPGAIILMHDGGDNRSTTVAAIPLVVDWLFGQGYSLTTVEQLL
jgi:peptidoglycan/xylan/chitin deacetylase (PgdA/CDA1 family)